MLRTVSAQIVIYLMVPGNGGSIDDLDFVEYDKCELTLIIDSVPLFCVRVYVKVP